MPAAAHSLYARSVGQFPSGRCRPAYCRPCVQRLLGLDFRLMRNVRHTDLSSVVWTLLDSSGKLGFVIEQLECSELCLQRKPPCTKCPAELPGLR